MKLPALVAVVSCVLFAASASADGLTPRGQHNTYQPPSKPPPARCVDIPVVDRKPDQRVYTFFDGISLPQCNGCYWTIPSKLYHYDLPGTDGTSYYPVCPPTKKETGQ